MAAVNGERLARVRRGMAARGLGQIVVTGTAAVYYLTGLWVEPHERLIALYITDTACTLYGNAIFCLPPVDGAAVCLHADGEDPVAALAAAAAPGPLGVDKDWPSRFLIPLMQARPDVIPLPGSPPVDDARLIKDAAEREALRRASRINDEVIEGAVAALREGVTEQELAALVNRLYRERGADRDGEQIVCFGAGGADPHHAPDQTVVRPGDSVIFDLFTPIDRYWCDMTRTVFFRQAGEEQRRVYELVRRANQTAEELVRPGVPLQELDRAARRVITEGGYGPYFTHRLGHGIGLDCHEPHDVGEGSTVLAQPGMVFSVEPGIYLPGRFGVRVEDLVLVTEGGCEVLNHADKDLRIVG